MKTLLAILTLIAILGTPHKSLAVTDGPKFPLNAVQTLYASTNVGSTYVQLVASTTQKVNAVLVSDSGGQTMLLGFGPSCTSITATVVVPKNSLNLYLSVGFPIHTAVCIKSLGSTVSTGENDLNVFN